jgi:hypothetical protein
MGDMARSIGLMALVVGVTLLAVPGLLHPGKSQRFPPVDYSDYVHGFGEVTGQAALVPQGLPGDWRANAGALTGTKHTAHLHIGWAVPGSAYAGLEESVAPPATFIPSVLGRRGATVTGSASISGTRFDRRTSSRGEPALTRTVGGVTVVVTGSASAAQLATLAGSLQPRQPLP